MARIWIYQAERKLNEEEASYLLEKMDQFARDWTAHGKQLVAQALLRYQQFLIIRVDEGMVKATGCSIDKSTTTIKEVQQELGVDFFNRMLIAYRDPEGIKTVSREAFEKLIESGVVTEETVVFNNMVDTGEGLENHWEVPLKNSWHAQVFGIPS